ncbi:MAG TPA: hypothetical protein VFA34_15690 [Actinomycetota bacterium]|nr:hypothetical protein [Actinomycetota bacterium]
MSHPLSSADKRAGWDEDLRKEWRNHFIRVREQALAGEWAHDERYHLMRWLNFDGIGRGPLADRFAAFQRQLRDRDPERPYEGTTGAQTRKFLDQLGVPHRRGRFAALGRLLAGRR